MLQIKRKRKNQEKIQGEEKQRGEKQHLPAVQSVVPLQAAGADSADVGTDADVTDTGADTD